MLVQYSYIDDIWLNVFSVVVNIVTDKKDYVDIKVKMISGLSILGILIDHNECHNGTKYITHHIFINIHSYNNPISKL